MFSEFIDFLTYGHAIQIFNNILSSFFLDPYDDGFLPFTLFTSILILGFILFILRRLLFGHFSR